MRAKVFGDLGPCFALPFRDYSFSQSMTGSKDVLSSPHSLFLNSSIREWHLWLNAGSSSFPARIALTRTYPCHGKSSSHDRCVLRPFHLELPLEVRAFVNQNAN